MFHIFRRTHRRAGATVKEAKADFANSMQEVKASEEEREGAAAPILSAVPVFSFDLSSLFEYYSMLNVSAFARYLGINETLMRQYKKGNTYISAVQLQKIEDGLHRLGLTSSGFGSCKGCALSFHFILSRQGLHPVGIFYAFTY